MPGDGVEVHCGPIHDWDALGGLRGATHATSRHLTNNFAGAGSASRGEAERTTPFLSREPVDATARECQSLSLAHIPHPFP